MPKKRRLLHTIAFMAALSLAIPVTATGVGVAAFAALPFIASAMPLEMSRVLLSDGTRQVEIQGMIHIAAPAFYRDVADLVARRRAEGWLVFYEGVVDDPGRGNEAFTDVLGRLGGDLGPIGPAEVHPYEMMAPMIAQGVVLQDNTAILGQPGPGIRNVDLSLSELLQALPPAPPSDCNGKPEEPFDFAEVREVFDTLPSWIQSRVRAAFQILLATTTSGRFAHQVLPPAITALREERVARAVAAEPAASILVIYGQIHVDAIWTALQTADASWRVVSATGVKPF